MRVDYTNVQSIIDSYNDLFSLFIIDYNDEYYIADKGDEVYAGRLSELFDVINSYLSDMEKSGIAEDEFIDAIYNSEVFGSIVDDAVKEAADTVISEKTAFDYALDALKKQYNLD
ncbi:MAG: hypothetical protein IJE78_04970 [Bacteroidaceae bacterium]|nr:hypothetical protein [Bacteroidaceae bacterium]